MRVFAYGRVEAVPSRTWERVIRQQGWQRVKRGRGADLIVVGAGAASKPAVQITDEVAEFRQDGQEVLSERAFLRKVGLLDELAAEPRSFSAGDLAARAKLAVDVVDMLALFDVIEPADGLFGFRDLKAAVQAGRLLRATGLADLVYACGKMREHLGVASPLSELNVQVDSEGRIGLGAGERVAEITGQFRLDLQHAAPTVAVLLADAEEAREAGNSAYAVQLLRRALAASPKDLDALFELGSLLCEQEHFAEGITLLRKATGLRPGFADAWYNIGHALERQGRRGEAKGAYERAIAADPDYADPHYNLAMIDLTEDRFVAAIAGFESYLRLDPQSAWAAKAKKALALARMSAVQAKRGAT